MRKGIAAVLLLFLAGCTSIQDVVATVEKGGALTNARIDELVQDRRMVRDAYRSAVQDEISGLKMLASSAMVSGDIKTARTYWNEVYKRLEEVYADHLDIGAKFDSAIERLRGAFRDDTPGGE